MVVFKKLTILLQKTKMEWKKYLLICAVITCRINIQLAQEHSSGSVKTDLITVDVEEEADADDDESISIDEDDGVMNEEPFVPTDEWQIIKRGQSIPAGLHVRVDMQTGIKEARLMPPSTDSSGGSGRRSSASDGGSTASYWADPESGRRGMKLAEAEGTRSFTLDELKHALKEFKYHEQDSAALPGGSRSAEMHRNYLSDSEVMLTLLSGYNHTHSNHTDKLDILEHMEYLVHQIDNGATFVDIGWLSILVKELNSSSTTEMNENDTELITAIIHVLGSAMNNNPYVQISALDSGVLHILLRALSSTISSITAEPDLAGERVFTLLSRIVYSISTLLRRLPLAQERFLHLGGLDTSAQLFKLSHQQKQLLKQQVKLITLIYDLIIEKEDVLKEKTMDESKPEYQQQLNRKEQYARVPEWFAVLSSHGWCNHLVDVLSQCDNDDQRDKVLSALHMLVVVGDTCTAGTKSHGHEDMMGILYGLENSYRQYVESDSEDDFYTHLLYTTHDLIQHTAASQKQARDEL